MNSTVKVNRDDLNEVSMYLEVLNGEKKDYEPCSTPRTQELYMVHCEAVKETNERRFQRLTFQF